MGRRCEGARVRSEGPEVRYEGPRGSPAPYYRTIGLDRRTLIPDLRTLAPSPHRTGVTHPRYIWTPVIIRRHFLDGIQKGTVTLAFRRWRRPSVKSGGTLLTAAGLLHIGDIEIISVEDISNADAKRAGYDSRASLVEELNERREGEVFRIELGRLEPDPRIALRERRADKTELQGLVGRLEKLDARSEEGPWTRRVLEIIDAHPAVRAGDLCGMVGQEKLPFKLNVRKLKMLGLTESLEVGYRLSPRGVALLDRLRRGVQDE